MSDINRLNGSVMVVPDIGTRTKEETIRVLLDKVFEKKAGQAGNLPKDKVLEEIMTRERDQTTGIGEGLAFPHVRLPGWPHFIIVAGLSREGIDFDSVDKQPVHFVFLMISSEDEPYIILQSMSRLIRFFKQKRSPDYLLEIASPGEIAEEVRAYLSDDDLVVRAVDLMRPLKTFIPVDMPVAEVVKIMHLKHLDVMPVVDGEGKICGQISLLDILEHGIPDFFEHLSSVSFVRKFDPFEKYFTFKKNFTARDFMDRDCKIVSEAETLMEIVFLLTVKKTPRLFVAREGKLIGVVDRFSILDKVLFF